MGWYLKGLFQWKVSYKKYETQYTMRCLGAQLNGLDLLSMCARSNSFVNFRFPFFLKILIKGKV